MPDRNPKLPAQQPNMDPDTELQQAYEEVLKKIGRNLLLFQKAEFLIKHLMTLGNAKMIRGERTSFEEQASIWAKQTFGQLIKPFLEKHCTDKNPLADYSSDSGKTSIAISFTLGGFEGDFEAREKSFAIMVAERNDLVHHFLPKFDMNSLDGCRKGAVYLDEQREKVLPEFQRLQNDFKSITAQISDLLAYLGTDEGMAMLQPPEVG